MIQKSTCLSNSLVAGLLILFSCQGFAQTIYIDDNRNNLLSFDTSTGALSLIGNMGAISSIGQITDIAFGANQKELWGISFGQLYSINASTASVNSVGSSLLPQGQNNTFTSLVYGGGNLYSANQQAGPLTTDVQAQLYVVNTNLGTAQSLNSNPTGLIRDPNCPLNGPGVDSCGQVTTKPAFSSSGDLAFFNNSLYLTSTISTADSLVKLDYTSAAGSAALGTSIGSSLTILKPGDQTAQSFVYGLANVGTNLYAFAETGIFKLDTVTGQLSAVAVIDNTGVERNPIGATPYKFNGASYFDGAMVSGVPEPHTYSLFLAGLGVMGLLSRRRLRNAD